MDVAELTEAFKDQNAHPNQALLMQRVQELMGQGIDVSTFFATMVSSASTRDIAIKKIAYAFLAKYGHTNEELCFLGINTLHQDCVDLDPTVRALALRTLCSLGQRSVMRFMLQPLNKGLQDKNANVRKTAALACISIFELDPTFVLESEIVDRLYGLLSDKDTQVVISAIQSLEAILVDEGGVVINQAIANHLLRRYKDWTPGQLQVILGILCRYKPENDDEIYEIMDLSEIHEDVQTTVEETLLKHLDSPHPDLVFASLHHLALVLEKSRKMRHNSPQYLSMILCKPDDPIAIKLKKLEICTIVAQFSHVPVTNFILDHLCLVASMKELTQFQKSSRVRLDRQQMNGQLDVVCAAIESIAAVGAHYVGSQITVETESQTQEEIEKMKNIVDKACMDRLYQLLVLVSDLGNESERQKTGHKSINTTWYHQNLAALNLEESQVAIIQSTLLIAIEACWQRGYDMMRHNINPLAERQGYHGIMDASQVRILGLLLLRHLDQNELDRMAKRWKPLKYHHDNTTSATDTRVSSPNLVEQLQQQQQRPITFPGDISPLARLGGLRMLLLEESIQHHLLLNLINPKEENDTAKMEATKLAIEKRAPYVELLQQQVQDIVQSMDTTPYSSAAAGPSDNTIKITRERQLATLQLACHLVAFSIEHQDLSQSTQSVYAQRLSILEQAVARLLMKEEKAYPPSSQQTMEGEGDLLALGDENRALGHTQQTHNSDSNNTKDNGAFERNKVSRDVIDQAQMIYHLFLCPLLLDDKVASAMTAADALSPIATSTGSSSAFDSPLFKTEKYRQLVRQKFVAQFGVSSSNKYISSEVENKEDHDNNMIMHLEKRLYHDWCFQIGFNTLTVMQ
ncbi:AP-4 complex subunit beta-1 [Linnemannia zychae]|nr:AP-4 complex subunit beta-1 [Linnemannia zychae]